MAEEVSPILKGASLAVLAALAFGVTTPIIEQAGRGVGPLTTAALLYAGAFLSAVPLRFARRGSGSLLRKTDLRRLVLIALLGAALGPTLLAWGLQRTGAITGSLLLNLEAAFTVLLSWVFHREPIGRRVAVALALMAIGGGLLTLDAVGTAAWSALGAVAVVGATFAWALDNTLTRPLAEHDPVSVVGTKAALGAAVTGVLAVAFREPLPSATSAAVLLASGATGYGLSLRFYLLAQRRIGAARAASVFALAPFVGATVAWPLGDRTAGVATAISAALFGLGVLLHLTERHRHLHRHLPLEHEHAHRHEDGHHHHAHEPPVLGEHTHRHVHEAIEHDHEHAPDVHHAHDHTGAPPAGLPAPPPKR